MRGRRLFAGLAMAAGMAGCYPELPGDVVTLDGQVAAARIIWDDCYRMTGDGPTVHWVTGDELDCGDPDTRGFTVSTHGGCWDGVSTPDGSSLSWQPGMRMSDTAMAHEFAHVREYDRGHDGHAHPIAIFGPSEPDGVSYSNWSDSEVGRANMALAAAGL